MLTLRHQIRYVSIRHLMPNQKSEVRNQKRECSALGVVRAKLSREPKDGF